jgi:hypothetical protein
MLKGTQSFSDGMKKIFQGMADAVISSLTKILMNMALFGNQEGKYKSGEGLLGTVVKGVGSLFSPSGGGSYSSMNWGGGADYGSFGYQSGGLAIHPQIATLAEHGPEAVIPLDKFEGGKEPSQQIMNINIFTLDTTTMEQWVRKNSKVFVDLMSDDIRRGGQLKTAVRGA